jgi:hypothetical protein
VLVAPQRVPQLGTDHGTKEGKTAARVTVSLPTDIADYLRARAEELQEPVSWFVAETIRWRQASELREAMVQGLLEDAERDAAFVAEWAETLPELPD